MPFAYILTRVKMIRCAPIWGDTGKFREGGTLRIPARRDKVVKSSDNAVIIVGRNSSVDSRQKEKI